MSHRKGDFQSKKKAQDLVFPEGLYLGAKKRRIAPGESIPFLANGRCIKNNKTKKEGKTDMISQFSPFAEAGGLEPPIRFNTYYIISSDAPDPAG